MAEIQCASCGRRDGVLASGIVINDSGCTGACLHWALQVIDNPPYEAGGSGIWEEWEVGDEECLCIHVICSDVNPEGCALLASVPMDFGSIMVGEQWIAILQSRYEHFLVVAAPERILATCPRLPGIYSIICSLHRQLFELPVRILTVKVAMCADAMVQASTCTMSGQTICEQKFSRTTMIGEYMAVVRQQFELPFRVPVDYNMYTRDNFVAYYGEEDGQRKWSLASVVYNSSIVTVSEDGQEFQRDDELLTSLLILLGDWRSLVAVA